MLKQYRVLIFTVIVVLFFTLVFFAGYFGKPQSSSAKKGSCCGMDANSESGEMCQSTPSSCENP